MWSNLVFPGCFLFLGGCLEDRSFPAPEDSPGIIRNLRPGMLRINEIQPSGNAAGEPGDWVELINTTDSILVVSPGTFWITEDKSEKFAFTPSRSYSIPARGFLSVFFVNGGSDTASGYIVNTRGNLSSAGEFVGFYLLRQPGDTVLLDTVSFPAVPVAGQTYGRIPDASGAFRWLPQPSRNQSNNNQPAGDVPPGPDRLVINEIDPNGSPDWFELANPLADSILLKAGRWFFSDDTTMKEKYPLPVDFVLSGKQYVAVECNTNGPDAGPDQLRVKFSLSSAGESVAIYYRDAGGKLICVQKVDFPPGIPAGQSFARKPDLTGPHSLSSTPSRGIPNP